jgi:hypothetical protein
MAYDGGADAVVAHADVADAVNGGLHSTFTFAVFRPAGSNLVAAVVADDCCRLSVVGGFSRDASDN